MSARPTPAELQSLTEQAVALARAAGAEVADACAEGSRAFTVRVHGGGIESLKQSGTLGIGVRAIVGGAVGFASGTDTSREGLADLAARAVALARFATPDEARGAPTPAEAGESPADDLDLFDPAAADLDVERKIAMALELERIALAHDARVTRSDGSAVSSAQGTFAIANSHGLARAWQGTSVSAWVVALAEDGVKQQTGVHGMARRHLADLPTMESIAREAARRAVARVGARTVPTARVPVVMHPDIAASWLAEMYDAMTADALVQKRSWLEGRESTLVASNLVNIVDDGRLVRGLGSSPYDGEGVPTRRNVLVDAGVFRGFAHDHYHARRLGTRSTGNGSRGFASTPGIGYHNLCIARGATPVSELIARIDRGFYYDDSGSFGFNPVTGDYSFQAQGMWIEKGERVHPVDGVTVAGNSLQMLRDIVAVGDDLEWRGAVASPSLLISEMTVSGS